LPNRTGPSPLRTIPLGPSAKLTVQAMLYARTRVCPQAAEQTLIVQQPPAERSLG
jgi:hypothetical protein